MNILVIGNGGREHALAVAIARSPMCARLIAAPGNPGMEAVAECLPLDATDHAAVIRLARENKIDCVVIGPEAPLVAGLGDALEAAGIPAFGPSKAAAQLEGSKIFARDFCKRHGIPQPGFARFTESGAAIDHIKEHYPKGCVVKADGLAAGKGVVVADTAEDAIAAAKMMLDDNRFGDASASIVIEERITGTEASLFALADGRNAVFMGSAQDYKRAHDGDSGPNTGGMGAVSPAPALSDALQEKAWEEIVLPVIAGMADEGMPYRGFLYCGLMLTQSGPQVIEFNCRFGDPEAQTILPRLKSDLLSAILTAHAGGLDAASMQFHDNKAVTVIMANGGYPGDYTKGAVITGLDDGDDTAHVFHAGTARDENGNIIATGGRVLAITAMGATREAARVSAYKRVNKIKWKNRFQRWDIAFPDWKPLQEKYRPEKVRVLFIGESPPQSGGYFYTAKKSMLFSCIEKAFWEKTDARKENFLHAFKKQGFFLDDLMFFPVNKMKNGQEKTKRILFRAESQHDLAERIKDYAPEQIVCVMKGIDKNVMKSIALSNINMPYEKVVFLPFPSYGRQTEFMETLSRLDIWRD